MIHEYRLVAQVFGTHSTCGSREFDLPFSEGKPIADDRVPFAWLEAEA